MGTSSGANELKYECVSFRIKK